MFGLVMTVSSSVGVYSLSFRVPPGISEQSLPVSVIVVVLAEISSLSD